MKVLGLLILIIKLSNALIKQPRYKWIIKNNNINTIQQQFFLQAKSRSHDSYPHNNNHHHSHHNNNDEDYDGDDDNLHIERWEKSRSPSLEELFERDGVMYLCAQSPHSQEDDDNNSTIDCIENNPFSSPKFELDMSLNDDEEGYNNNANKNKKKIITLPIMPFESPLFLGSKEFLYIYEMRFRTMMNNVEFQHDNFLGRCYLSENGEVGLVGSLCKIVEKKKMEDGKGFFIIEAVQRFKIRKVVQSEPFLTAEVELDYEDEDENVMNNNNNAVSNNIETKNSARITNAKAKTSLNNSNNNNNNSDDIKLCENLCHDVYTLLKIYLRIHKIQKHMLSNINIGMGVGVGGTVSSGTRGGGSSSSSSGSKIKSSSSSSSSSSTAVSATASDSSNGNNHQNNDKFSSSSTDTSNISFQPAVHNNRPRSGLVEVDFGRSRHQAFSHACANILSTEPSILQQIFQSTSISYRLHGVKRILTEAVDELSTLMIEDGILTRELLMSIINMSTNIADDDSDLLPPNGQPQDVSLECEVDSRFHHFPSSSGGSSTSTSSNFSSSTNSRGSNINNYKTPSWNDYISSDGYDCSSDEGTEDDYYNYGSYSRNDGIGNSHYGSSYDYHENGSNSYYDIHNIFSRHHQHNYDNINTDSSDVNNKGYPDMNNNKKKQQQEQQQQNEMKKEGLKREIAAYKKQQQQSQPQSQSQQQSQSKHSQRITPITAAATTTIASTTATSTQTQEEKSNTNKNTTTNSTDKEWAADEGNSFQ